MGWPTAVDAQGWMRRVERRIGLLERRSAGSGGGGGGGGSTTLAVQDTATLDLTLTGSSSAGYTIKGDVIGGPGGGSLAQETLVLSATTGQFTEEMASVYSIDLVTFTTVTAPKARLRIYRTSAGRAADVGRLQPTPYPGGRALMYEYVATASGEIDYEEPVLAGAVPGDGTMYFVIDGTAQVSLTWTKIVEAA